MNEREIVRDLAKRYAEIALSDETKAKAANWGRLNALDSTARPPVIIDQICWHEFGGEEELRCVCEDGFLRGMETYFRYEMYRHDHFGADLVLPPFYPVSKVFEDT